MPFSNPLVVLHGLEKENRFVFHGSGLPLTELEPRQAHNYVNGVDIPDGAPAVFASPHADYAIFMAIINMITCPKGFRSGSGVHDGKLTFRATQAALDQLSDKTSGYVYVFNRSDFEYRNDEEWVSFKKVTPVQTIVVTRADFKPQIEMIE